MSGELFESFRPWLGEVVLAAGGAVLLTMARIERLAVRAGDVALLVLAASCVAAVISMDVISRDAALGLVAVDPFAAFFEVVLNMAALACAWLASRQREIGDDGGRPPAAWAAFLLSVAGLNLMASSASLVAAWAGFAAAIVGSALWIGISHANEPVAASRALVLLLEGAAASVLLLAGCALVHALGGTLAYDALGGRLAVALAAPGGRIAVSAAIVLVLGGALWRTGLPPWERSRVELAAGGPLSDLAWFLTGPAIASFAMLARFLRSALSSPVADGDWTLLAGVEWPAVVSFVAIVAMVLGNVAAVRESNARRFVAWLTVTQAGYLATGLVAGSDAALEGMLVHAVACAVMTFGLVAALAPVFEQAGSEDFEVLRGLARRRGSAKAIAAAVVVFVLGFCAVWPLGGYTGRAMLLEALVRSDATVVAAFAAVASAIGLVVLVRVVAMLLDSPPDADENVAIDFEAVVLAGVATAAVAGLGLWPGPLSVLAARSVVFFGG